jgi:hypothetical protein
MISSAKRAAAAPRVTFARFGASAKADESSDADVILKTMSNCVTGQKSITAAVSTDNAALTPDNFC